MGLEVEQIESKLFLRPHSPLFSRLAYEYLSANRVEDAKELCRKGIDKYPSYATAHLLLAKCLEAENDFNSALESIQIAKALNPNAQVITDLHSKIESQLSHPIIEELEDTPSEQTDILQPTEDEQTSDVIDNTTSSSDLNLETVELKEDLPLTSQYKEHAEPNPDLSVEDNTPDTVEDEMATIVFESIPPAEEDIESSVDNNERLDTPNVISEELLDSIPLASSSGNEQQYDSSNEETVVEEQIGPDSPQALESETTEKIEDDPHTTSIQDDVNLNDDQNTSYQEPLALAKEYLTSIEDGGRIVSKTLAEIYAAQGEYNEAIITYQLLKQQQPSRSEEFDKRITELEDKIGTKTD